MTTSRRRRQRGFTLLEVVVFIIVVSVGVAGILAVFNTSVGSSADPMVRKQALAVAEALMEEILAKEYVKPAGGSTGGPRTNYDCVDDYNGYTSVGVVDGQGNTVASLSQYNVSPAVAVVATTGLPGVAMKQITVSVTGPGNSGTITLVGYRGNY